MIDNNQKGFHVLQSIDKAYDIASLENGGTKKRDLNQYEVKELLYLVELYRHVIDLTITKEYTHPSAWAHIVPEENRSCILPHEFIDYRLGFSRVLGHEKGHKIMQIYGLPDGDEDMHTNNAYQNLNDKRVEVRSKYTF